MGTEGFNDGRQDLDFLVVIMTLQGAFSLLKECASLSVSYKEKKFDKDKGAEGQ